MVKYAYGLALAVAKGSLSTSATLSQDVTLSGFAAGSANG